jgi:type IV secretory pathway VirB10-like protein
MIKSFHKFLEAQDSNEIIIDQMQTLIHNALQQIQPQLFALGQKLPPDIWQHVRTTMNQHINNAIESPDKLLPQQTQAQPQQPQQAQAQPQQPQQAQPQQDVDIEDIWHKSREWMRQRDRNRPYRSRTPEEERAAEERRKREIDNAPSKSSDFFSW